MLAKRRLIVVASVGQKKGQKKYSKLGRVE